MGEMTETRKGEIALALLKAKLKREGIKLSTNSRREIGQAAKETGISREELEQFMLAMLPEIIGSALGFQRVSLTTGDPIQYTEPSGGAH